VPTCQISPNSFSLIPTINRRIATRTSRHFIPPLSDNH
jgi:hypothetical protein